MFPQNGRKLESVENIVRDILDIFTPRPLSKSSYPTRVRGIFVKCYGSEAAGR